MGKLSTVIAFFTGTAIGGATVWYITRERYARLAEDEINSVKEAYAHIDKKKEKAEEALCRYRGVNNESDDPDTEIPKIPAVTTKMAEKGSIAEYVKRVQNGAPMKYSRTVVPSKADTPEAPAQSEVPYVISPDEFNELDDYMPVSLVYYADGILADEHGLIIDDEEEIIGDGLSHFGEYEDDSVFVRNDVKRCDYEILRDERTYAEFRKTLPDNI